ncbi:hypothetical protein [Luteolibacter marinus]|uniref:hypothetical protein n=1 Tax=Luteolibacter marinus TaxID=2776705 RepID=UPI0018660F29|nr:hypothetical protein [Luteolibacter marinus]
MALMISGRYRICGLADLMAAAWIQGAQAREWTNDQGRTIEAEYVSSDGTSVVLEFNGKEVTYELSRPSEDDRK